MYPTKQSKLLFQISLLERHYESHKTDSVQRKTDYAVIGRKR